MVIKVLQFGSKYLFQSYKSYTYLKSTPCITHRLISTTKKTKDTVTLADTLPKAINIDLDKAPPKNFITWGFSSSCVERDNSRMHLAYFLGITMALVFTSFIFYYQPDNRMIDWTRREAFLELRHRESLGLPLIDRELIPLDIVDLPTDEELGDIRIII